MTRYDVVICGAGVGGLTLARALGIRGRRVLVLDKQLRNAEPYKGEVLQPHSLLVLEEMGLLPQVLGEAALVNRLVCAQPSGKLVCALDYRQLPRPYNQCRVHYYTGIIDLLARDLPTTVELRRGVTAKSLVVEDDRVTGVRVTDGGEAAVVRAGLVAAADGYASGLRGEAGIKVEMDRYEHQVVAFDLTAPDLAPDAVTYVTRHGIRLLYPMPGGRGRFYAQVPRGSFNKVGRAGFGDWVDWLLGTVPDLAPLGERLRDGIGDARVLSARRFLSPVWHRPGFVLVGDAAHAVHPMAGQGMNAAIADGHGVARHLAGVDTSAPEEVDGAVACYVADRAAKMEFVGRFSHNFATLFTSTTWRERVLAQHILRRHRSNERLSFKVMYNLSGLGVLRFSTLDRLHQLGLFDPRAKVRPTVRCVPPTEIGATS
ncbi:FAD-dependent oxidoreductase [Amycolatopsis samaneae]|uniref:NAD(P)/FAD-dependent oxidoreductase n=1 Tax=Amycolatopsis samaneae TaxID=664691 RepID=A0ABW5GPF3_9PSEU